MEMEPDEPGRDAGVVGEGGRDGLTHERLGVGAGGVVEPHLQLRQARRRQQQAHGGGQRHRACQAAAHLHPESSIWPCQRHCIRQSLSWLLNHTIDYEQALVSLDGCDSIYREAPCLFSKNAAGRLS